MSDTANEAATIGRYELVTRLATGGMAELFLARERGLAGLERLVVVKQILPHLARNSSFVDMFKREARIAARLNHPNVVQIYELGEASGTYYIAMEYIEGSTVREIQVLAEREGVVFPIEVAVGMVLQALRGLHAAHELKDLEGNPLALVHRDVSPHNLMCTGDGHVKLVDFGVAKSTALDNDDATYSGSLKGKFSYMSPEQCLRKPLDRRSDIFAMGIVLWELCTGRRLFKRSNELEMMQAITQGDVPRPSTFRPDLPQAVEDAAMKALQVEREARFQSAEEMRKRLLEIARQENLLVSSDRIETFVRQVAREQLQMREVALKNALERSLTAHERLGLLHVTSSEAHDTIVDGDVSRTEQADSPAHERAAAPEPSPEFEPEPSPSDPMTTAETAISPHLRQALASREAALAEAAPEPGPREERAGSDVARSGRALIYSALVGLMLGGALLLIWHIATDGANEQTEASEPVLLGEPLRIAWAPTVDPELLREEIKPLQKYLATKLERPVEVEVTSSYLESSRKLRSGEVAFAVLPPLMYVRTKAADHAVEPVALKLYDGSRYSDGFLLVRANSGVQSLTDLEGKTFCFTDKNSTTGHFLPRAYIRRQGLNPDAFIGGVHWSGDHIQGLRDLLDEKCDAAATYSGAYLSADELGVAVSRIRNLAITGHVPQEALVAGPHATDSDKRRLRDALLALDPLEEFNVKRLGETQRISGFVAASDKDFDFLREVIEQADTDANAPDAAH